MLIWTGLAGGDEEYCVILVAINSMLQMILYAPSATLLVRIINRSASGISVSYSTVATSVGVFLGIPLAAAIVTRISLCLVNTRWYEATFLKWIASLSLIGLPYTVAVLFAS